MQAEIGQSGTRVAVIATGSEVALAMGARAALAAEGIAARVLNVATVSDLDRGAILAAADETGRIVTVSTVRVLPLRLCACPWPLAWPRLPGA